MNATAATSESVLDVLKSGASLRYYFLSGGVALVKKDGETSETKCAIGAFLDLREKKLIDKTGDRLQDYSNRSVYDKYDVV